MGEWVIGGVLNSVEWEYSTDALPIRYRCEMSCYQYGTGVNEPLPKWYRREYAISNTVPV